MVLYSTDLAAAFDMLDPGLFETRLKNIGIPKNLRSILVDYMKERMAYIDINGETSEIFDIILGCTR